MTDARMKIAEKYPNPWTIREERTEILLYYEGEPVLRLDRMNCLIQLRTDMSIVLHHGGKGNVLKRFRFLCGLRMK
jgi:UDP-N-acetylglucosamine transferase subunit ALG13